jgi:glutamine synthetase
VRGRLSRREPHSRRRRQSRISPSPPRSPPGLHGIASGLKAPKLYEGNAYEDATLPQVPKTLREAIAELERSKVARTAFGERVIEHYLHTARLEQGAFDQVVTDWELARNFERI